MKEYNVTALMQVVANDEEHAKQQAQDSFKSLIQQDILELTADEMPESWRPNQCPDMVINTGTEQDIQVYRSTDPHYPGVFIDIGNEQVALIEYLQDDEKFAIRAWGTREEDPEYNQFRTPHPGDAE